jgi:hypothetical protein
MRLVAALADTRFVDTLMSIGAPRRNVPGIRRVFEETPRVLVALRLSGRIGEQ